MDRKKCIGWLLVAVLAAGYVYALIRQFDTVTLPDDRTEFENIAFYGKKSTKPHQIKSAPVISSKERITDGVEIGFFIVESSMLIEFKKFINLEVGSEPVVYSSLIDSDEFLHALWGTRYEAWAGELVKMPKFNTEINYWQTSKGGDVYLFNLLNNKEQPVIICLWGRKI